MTTHNNTAVSAGPKPAPKRILVIYKRTKWVEYQETKNKRMLKLIAQGHPSVKYVVPTHLEHEATLAEVRKRLRKAGMHFKAVRREQIARELRKGGWDLIATVGGDGTVLEAARYVQGETPILAINSAVGSSFGHFCLADMNNFEQVLNHVLAGKRRPIRMQRLEVVVDGTPLPELVLNEVKFAHPVDGETSRYNLHINKREIAQKSDGIFFGPAGGSTAWMRSYHCKVMPIASRRFQWVVRGLIVQKREDHDFAAGMLRRSDHVRIVSRMPDATLLIDGSHCQYHIEYGSEVIIRPSNNDLVIYADRDSNERYAALVK